MTFAGINYIAVLVAGALGFGARRRLVIACWPSVEGGARLHRRANPRTSRQGAGPWPLVIAFVADLVMA